MNETVPLNDLQRAARAQAPELSAVFAQVVDSGWFVHGSHHRRFETALADYLEVKNVLGVASGTDALELALRAVSTRDRRIVITVANAGAYTTCAAIAAGLDVAFCDVDPVTHNMSIEALPSLLSERIAAVVATHLYGRLADVTEIKELCAPWGIPVIEDCAQSLGARTNHGMGGALGDLATFSFYPTKNLGAIGDGGAIATSDPILAERIGALRQYGWTGKYRNEIKGGRNSRLDEVQAGILEYRLQHLDRGNSRRRDIITQYEESAPRSVRILPAEGENHAGHLAVAETDYVSQLASHLQNHGIATEVHYPVPDHHQPFMGSPHAYLPVTEALVGRVLSLPCFPELTDYEIDRVCEALQHFDPKETP